MLFYHIQIQTFLNHLQNTDVAKAFYGITNEELQSKFSDAETRKQISANYSISNR